MGDTPDDDKWKCPHCVAMETVSSLRHWPGLLLSLCRSVIGRAIRFCEPTMTI